MTFSGTNKTFIKGSKVMRKEKTQGVTMSPDKNYQFVESYVEEFLNFLYPESQTGRRSPLTRCLFIGLGQMISLFKEEEEQTFQLMIEYLDKMLLITQNKDISQSERVQLLLNQFYEIGDEFKTQIDLEIEEYAIDAFCYYDKVDAQRYTIACLMFDLLPLINMNFRALHIAIENHQTTDEIISFQSKQALYNQDNDYRRILYSYIIAKHLFNKNDVTKKSMFIVAALMAEFFEVNYNGLTVALDFHIDSVKDELRSIIKKGKIECDELFAIDNRFVNLLTYLKHISEASEITNIAVHVLERILFFDCKTSQALQFTIQELITLRDKQKEEIVALEKELRHNKMFLSAADYLI